MKRSRLIPSSFKHIVLPALAIALLAGIATSSASAQVTFSEVTGGELSGNNLSPTDLGVFSPGTNSVSGLVVDALGANPNVDVFTFEIAADNQLDSIVLNNFISTDNVAFLGFNDSSSFPFDATALSSSPDQSLFTGGILFGTTGVDILPAISNGGIGDGFSTPVGPGDYTVYLQQLGGAQVEYEFQFNVSSTAVPEPTSALILAGLGVVGLVRRRR